jgi:hypothetical protein
MKLVAPLQLAATSKAAKTLLRSVRGAHEQTATGGTQKEQLKHHLTWTDLSSAALQTCSAGLHRHR